MAVCVAVGVAVGIGVGVAEGVGVAVGVGVGVGFLLLFTCAEGMLACAKGKNAKQLSVSSTTNEWTKSDVRG